MKRRRLRKFVLPTLYLIITISVLTIVILIGSNVELKNIDYDYGIDTLNTKVEPVVSEDEMASKEIKSPIEEDSATISVRFYEREDTEDNQKNSLIYYENTYLPNTGIIYTNDKDFNVLAMFNGKVIDILDDEYFGNVIVIEHTNSLKSYYYGIDKMEVSVGDELTTGTILGTSKVNDIIESKSSFLFEVYYNNSLVNPEKVIGTNISDYK